MTLFGLDASNYQWPLHLAIAKAQGYHFVMAKCTEGSGYADPHYPIFKQEAEKANQLFAAYHFLHHGNIVAQVNNLERHLLDKSIPVMLDVERSSDNPTMADARAFRAEAARRGIRVTLLYLPRWYWSSIGSPGIGGWHLVQSAYRSSAHKLGSALYPGDHDSNWNAFGGSTPAILQFGSTALIEGYSGNVDVDAFRGSYSDLAKTGYFKVWGEVSTEGVNDMQTNDKIARWSPEGDKKGDSLSVGMTLNQARGYAEDAYNHARAADARSARIENAIKALASGLGDKVKAAVEAALADATVDVNVNVDGKQVK